MLWQTEGNLEA